VWLSDVAESKIRTRVGSFVSATPKGAHAAP